MMMSSPRNPDRFDDSLRALHRQAVQAVPWQLQARLQPLPAAARPTAEPTARHRVLLASAAGLLALTMGLLILPRSDDATVPATALAPAASSVPAVVDVDSADALGVDPDFYAWLASDDAGLLAME